MSDNSGDVIVDKLPAEELKRKPDEHPAAGDQTVKTNEEPDSPKKLHKKDSARKSTSPKSKSPSTPRRTKSKDKKHSSDSESAGDELTEAEDLGASTGSMAGQSEVFNAVFRHFNLKNKGAPNSHIPKPRSAHASAVIGHKIYIFGGHAEAIEQQPCFGDFHVLNASRKTWKRAKHHSHKSDFPVPRFGHSADAVGNKIYIFGGLDSTQTHCLNDLHVFDIVDCKWSKPEIHGTAPAPRAYHTSCVVGTKLFIFGGSDKQRRFGDGFVFDTEENKWNAINFSSVPFLKRYFHTCYSYNDRVYLFAGESNEENHHFNDIYVLDTDSMEFGPEILATGAEPRGRTMHAVTQLTLDEHDYLVVFGGKGEEHFNDITLLDLDSHKWYHCHIKGKPAMPRHAHTASTVGSKIYIFGGYGIKHRMNDVLILDFTNAKLMLSASQEVEHDNNEKDKDHKDNKDKDVKKKD